MASIQNIKHQTDAKLAAKPPSKKLVVICGLSGSGLSTASHFLEDAGYTAVDNLPLFLFDQLISREVEANGRHLVVSIDARTSGFAADSLLALMSDIRRRLGDQVMLIFLTTSEAELIRRFNAARRHHPLTRIEGIADLASAISRDSERMKSIDAKADLVIDTTGSVPADFRRRLLQEIGADIHELMPIEIKSFSYRDGLPDEVDLVFDMRFLVNPHWSAHLAEATGRDQEVQDFICLDPAFDAFMEHLKKQLDVILPLYQKDGRPQCRIGFGCTGGRHRSVFAAEYVAEYLRGKSYDIRLSHQKLTN